MARPSTSSEIFTGAAKSAAAHAGPVAQPKSLVRWPFVVFGLPRSRTAWLTKWLSYGPHSIGHDRAIVADSVQGFLDDLWRLSGTVETGAVDGWKLLRVAMPESKFYTIRRPLDAVTASFERIGITVDRAQLEERDAALDAVEAAGATRIPFEKLDSVHVCAALFEELLGIPFDFRWWQAHAAANLQIDMPERIRFLAAHADRISALKQEVGRLNVELEEGDAPHFLRIGPEPISSIVAAGKELIEAHHYEVNDGELPNRPIKMDVPLLEKAEATGALRSYSARINGNLVGYITWSIAPDAENGGNVVADQGGWYVDPVFAATLEGRRLQIGRKLMERTLRLLRDEGIPNAQLHHQTKGRGAKAGALFQRMGPHEFQRRYTLPLRSIH